MMYQHRVILLFLPILLLSNTALHAQTKTAAMDSVSFESIMEASMRELSQSEYHTDVQQKYAQRFYRYYLNHPDDKEHGEAALVHAFKYWGNTGAVDKVEQAMARLDYDSEFWGQLLVLLPNAYYRSEQKTQEDAIELLEGLKDKLTHSQSRSSLYLLLANHYYDHGNREELKAISQEMIRLNANKFHVSQALGYLYEAGSLNVGQMAPQFKAETIQGGHIYLPPSGKITLLGFWATWCGPCLPDIPRLKTIQESYPTSDLQIIGISLDDDPDKLEQFIRERNMIWPQVIEPMSWKGDIAKMYNVSGIPRTYVIDRNGKIIAKDLRGEELENEVARLMEQAIKE